MEEKMQSFIVFFLFKLAKIDRRAFPNIVYKNNLTNIFLFT